jgi:non-ribosomal peptide synthetase component F
MERQLELVIGILGILKAGGAYVPLDPSYPSERLRFMIEDAKPAVIPDTGRTVSHGLHRSEPRIRSAFNPSL